MGGFFGVTSKTNCMDEVFYGVDYHSHLGMKRAGVAAWNNELGIQRKIHSIENSPFRTKFENIFNEISGTSAIGCISDKYPQPITIRSKHGHFAIIMIGVILNARELIEDFLFNTRGHFDAMTGGWVNDVELVAALINQKDTFEEGIAYAQEKIYGTASILILKDDGELVAARDKFGRLPIKIGKKQDSRAVSFESYAYEKFGYVDERELGPGEVVVIRPNEVLQVTPPGKKMKICSFLWSYYGYPTSTYEGRNVEQMRYTNGGIMADNDDKQGFDAHIDYVGGVPDSGTPHAIGYANKRHMNFARAFIKYTPTWARSFMAPKQSESKKTANMKQIPVRELIEGKDLLFVDDSIVRGTQLQETVEFLYEAGAKSVHMRSACPPIMFGCKFLNFSRMTKDQDLISRKIIYELEGEEGDKHLDEYADSSTERGKKLRSAIAEKLGFSSLEFQSLEGVIEAIGLNKEDLCTYCWTGEE
ncbi:MAG: amidophosphoribosyltransferase [Coriobacteriia bacterium]|nr:amidophosphoribosyltransferase [Coriobacteriia bacterium]